MIVVSRDKLSKKEAKFADVVSEMTKEEKMQVAKSESRTITIERIDGSWHKVVRVSSLNDMMDLECINDIKG